MENAPMGNPHPGPWAIAQVVDAMNVHAAPVGTQTACGVWLEKQTNLAMPRPFAQARLRERGNSPTYCCYYHAPTLVIVSNEPTQWWAPMDCACALENIFLAARSLGIGSCWINQVGQTCDDPGVRAVLTRLGVPAGHKVYGCAALGYEPADAPVKEKKLKPGTVTIIR